jgi:hypothetical protein
MAGGDMMLFIAVSFLRFMAIKRICCRCHRPYLDATAEKDPGLCGQCLLIAFPSPMKEELLPACQETREIQP